MIMLLGIKESRLLNAATGSGAEFMFKSKRKMQKWFNKRKNVI